MLELMEPLEYVQAYLDDLLCISWGGLEDHLDNLDGFLSNFAMLTWKSMQKNQHSVHLKLNTWRHLFTRDDNKPQGNKVQATLGIQLPKGVKQLWHFLSMVQYYRDLLARWSDCLPLSPHQLESVVWPM